MSYICRTKQLTMRKDTQTASTRLTEPEEKYFEKALKKKGRLKKAKFLKNKIYELVVEEFGEETAQRIFN